MDTAGADRRGHKPRSQTEIEFDDQSPWGRYALSGGRAALLKLCHALPASGWAHRVAMWLRHPLKHRLRGPVDAEVWGYRLRLMPRGNLSESRLLFTPQFLDQAEMGFLKTHLGAGSVFLDIGANAGAYSFWAARWVGEAGRVIAFEPDPEMRRRLAFNRGTNGVENLRVEPIALSDQVGRASLAAHAGNHGQSRLVETAPPEAPQADTLDVPTQTLAGYCAANGVERIDALKIDIEGHEHRVMKHFFDHAPESRWPRAILFESCTDAQDQSMSALAETHGYLVSLRGRMNTVVERG